MVEKNLNNTSSDWDFLVEYGEKTTGVQAFRWGRQEYRAYQEPTLRNRAASNIYGLTFAGLEFMAPYLSRHVRKGLDGKLNKSGLKFMLTTLNCLAKDIACIGITGGVGLHTALSTQDVHATITDIVDTKLAINFFIHTGIDFMNGKLSL